MAGSCDGYSFCLLTHHPRERRYQPQYIGQSIRRHTNTQPRLQIMAALERPVTVTFPRILELPSGLKLEVFLTPPGPVTELDEERGVASPPGRRLAVCLHPWARLGGNMDDPCVLITIIFLRIDVQRHPVRSTTRGGVIKIEYLQHSFAHSHTITNSTFCATTHAVSGSHQVGSHSRAYKRERIYGNL